jgi:hypothetical protein
MALKPIRIQRKRVSGWKMPENTVSVTIPGKWGNPFKVVGDMIYGYAGHRRKILNPWVYIKQGDIVECLKLYKEWMDGKWDSGIVTPRQWTLAEFNELRGKNLCCWCKIGAPCHADVLLEICNPI